ncbi:hypothetical protein GUITHDRAFT_142126 [Guillardia theta CCMP2712]|uniref:Uncharacterized protein n=1 Tax=Guillardia theta (strain CCMP2712) TaxID=905079 RepID=L1IZE2_GUITC|nr:hypothetical protein GUITHDRAFT_142126 [Guillardia theta CCMP2712]EKX41195.1 hypothetical protein GUITHDRAFT_142126 [Guillardia theta CCMP2712]|eukprot:XP_005828175.1 hypothetical protein GUITHDRAFT_142126 [Guillardia theta CCMP2712]
MPRTLEEIRAAAKAGKEQGASGRPKDPEPSSKPSKGTKPSTNGSTALVVSSSGNGAAKYPGRMKASEAASQWTESRALVPSKGKDLTPMQTPKAVPKTSWKRTDVEDDGSQRLDLVSQTNSLGMPKFSSGKNEEAPAMHGVGEAASAAFDMTVNHCKLLILISKYAQCALTAEDNESWIRQVPLWVLIYEGIMKEVIQFDYAPCSVLLSYDGSSRRMFLNISQEAKSAIEDLREQSLLNGLKLSSEDYQSVTSFQVSLKGLQFLKTLPNSLFEEVNQFLYAPNAPHYDSELLEVFFDGENFLLRSKSGFQRMSDVTDVEDVSYVSSPFLPDSLRTRWGKPMISNAHRAAESSAAAATIRKDLDEAIVLSYCTVLVGEWVPFGANNIVALNERLGAFDRCQGGLFTALVDKHPSDTNFKVMMLLLPLLLPSFPSSSRIIIDFNLVRFINFEAEINFPEEDGMVQIEHFGMHINVDGTIFYGLKVEAIVDHGASDISLDNLSRVLVDVQVRTVSCACQPSAALPQLDSSKILNDLLTNYQRGLLDVLFLGDSDQRNKLGLLGRVLGLSYVRYCMVVADRIQPKMPAQAYVDRDKYENELKQVIGDLYMAHDIGQEDLIIVGKDGLILVGPNAVNLNETTDAINSKQLEETFRAIETNMKFLVDASAANERASASLAIMQVVLAGSFAFDIIDRIGGATLNIGPPQWVNSLIVEPLLLPPGVWLAVNFVWMAVLCYFLARLMQYLSRKTLGLMTVRCILNKKIKSEDGLLSEQRGGVDMGEREREGKVVVARERR